MISVLAGNFRFIVFFILILITGVGCDRVHTSTTSLKAKELIQVSHPFLFLQLDSQRAQHEILNLFPEYQFDYEVKSIQQTSNYYISIRFATRLSDPPQDDQSIIDVTANVYLLHTNNNLTKIPGGKWTGSTLTGEKLITLDSTDLKTIDLALSNIQKGQKYLIQFNIDISKFPPGRGDPMIRDSFIHTEVLIDLSSL